MKVIAYRIDSLLGVEIRKAPGERKWMAETPSGFAKRCRPLLIANEYGWQLINPEPFMAVWNGGPDKTDVRVVSPDTGECCAATAHFGSGILTFHVPYLFRTEPGWNMLVRGPANHIKDGIQALEGVVETDWLQATFTMNWRFTRPANWVRFEAGEPFCQISVQQRGDLERVEPEIRGIADNPELEAAYKAWTESRNSFNAQLQVTGSEEQQRGWQKDYFQGRQGPPDHKTKLSLGEFNAVQTQSGDE